MAMRLEHANLCVRDGVGDNGARWVHVGTDETSIALNPATIVGGEPWKPYGGRPNVNHLGAEGDDAKALRDRMRNAGYGESTVSNRHPHRIRVTFFDPEGNDWEFVQYTTDDLAKRNDYDLPDA